jgi:hypothetical protein
MIRPAGYRSCLARAQARTAPSDEDLLAMRRAAWRSRGVVVLRPDDVRDDWIRQALSARPATRSARIRPHKVRGRELEEVREKDPDGRIVYHHRTVDTLGKMLRAGTITQEMHDAAKDFQAAFIVANLDPLRALPVLRVPGTGREPELNERQLDARRRVHEALEALGGLSSPAGCSAACASGRSGRAGAEGGSDRSRRKEFSSRRSGCWRCTTVWRTGRAA